MEKQRKEDEVRERNMQKRKQMIRREGEYMEENVVSDARFINGYSSQWSFRDQQCDQQKNSLPHQLHDDDLLLENEEDPHFFWSLALLPALVRHTATACKSV